LAKETFFLLSDYWS